MDLLDGIYWADEYIMDECMDGWISRQTDAWIRMWTCAQMMDGWMDQSIYWTDEWMMNAWMDGSVDRQIYGQYVDMCTDDEWMNGSINLLDGCR